VTAYAPILVTTRVVVLYHGEFSTLMLDAHIMIQRHTLTIY